MGKIVVVGSLNMDLVLKVDRNPKVGETLKGDNINYFVGGKGSNQAVAAARLGNEVSMVGAVGDDTFGEKLIKHLAQEHVNVSSISIEDHTFTGIATIMKTPEDNSIVIVPGANDFCNNELVEKNLDLIKSADILITQFEVPNDTVAYALKKAKELGVQTILNPAPAREISKEILDNTDYITPNETEFEIISRKTLDSSEKLEAEMIMWQANNLTKLIVTRGADGVSFVEKGKVVTIPSIKVNVVDTTGAGDTFNGALAHCLSHKMNLREAISFASRAASLSVTRFGAQTGMPTIEEVEEIMK